MSIFRQLWHTFIVILVPAAAKAGSTEAWKDYQAKKDPLAEFLTIASIVAAGGLLLWVLSKVQGFMNKKKKKAKSKKKA